VTIPTLFKITLPPPNDQVSPIPTQTQAGEKELGPIPDQYIVVFKDRWNGVINETVGQNVLEFLNARISEFSIADSLVKSRYEHVLRGFTAKLTEEQLQAIKKDPRVDYVEQDRRFKTIGRWRQRTPWKVSMQRP
jgi:serine protease